MAYSGNKDILMAAEKNLLDILACPACKAPLCFQPEESRLVCDRCWLCFPIRAEIPILLIEEATPLNKL